MSDSMSAVTADIRRSKLNSTMVSGSMLARASRVKTAKPPATESCGARFNVQRPTSNGQHPPCNKLSGVSGLKTVGRDSVEPTYLSSSKNFLSMLLLPNEQRL